MNTSVKGVGQWELDEGVQNIRIEESEEGLTIQFMAALGLSRLIAVCYGLMLLDWDTLAVCVGYKSIVVEEIAEDSLFIGCPH